MSSHEKVKAQLEAKLQELTDRAARIEQRLGDPGNPDWQENAIVREDDEVLTGLSDVTDQHIHDIRLALHRIESGHYGICTSCGKSIPQARLSALPFTSTCIDCA